MLPRPLLICLASTIALTAPCFGASATVPEALQQEAMTCAGEAVEICPEIMTAEDHGLACMTGKRSSFSPRCRIIYDKVARTLRPR